METEEVGIGALYCVCGEVRKLRRESSMGEMEPVTFINWKVALVL